MSAIPIHDPTRPALANAVNEMRTTTCYMCACRCGIRVHLRNGEVRYIESFPAIASFNQALICANSASRPIMGSEIVVRKRHACLGAPFCLSERFAGRVPERATSD